MKYCINAFLVFSWRANLVFPLFLPRYKSTNLYFQVHHLIIHPLHSHTHSRTYTHTHTNTPIYMKICLSILTQTIAHKIHRESAGDIKRSLELAAYFTHCNLQPAHLMLALKTAMALAFKNKVSILHMIFYCFAYQC